MMKRLLRSSRLPSLERALLLTARKQQPSALRRRGLVALAMGTGALTITGGAVAAVEVLSTGDPVPASSTPRPAAITSDPQSGKVLGVEVDDPDGGPPWGLLTSRTQNGVCLIAGRLYGQRLGVLGRDGVFNNDGRFHPADPDSALVQSCGGGTPDATILAGASDTIPASGYSGPPGTPIGGCREDADLDGPTVGAQTAQRLRDTNVCPAASRRVLTYGFAGPAATRVTLRIGDMSQTLDTQPHTSGAYLFVSPGATAAEGPHRLSVTFADGTTCAGWHDVPFFTCLHQEILPYVRNHSSRAKTRASRRRR